MYMSRGKIVYKVSMDYFDTTKNYPFSQKNKEISLKGTQTEYTNIEVKMKMFLKLRKILRKV